MELKTLVVKLLNDVMEKTNTQMGNIKVKIENIKKWQMENIITEMNTIEAINNLLDEAEY